MRTLFNKDRALHAADAIGYWAGVPDVAKVSRHD